MYRLMIILSDLKQRVRKGKLIISGQSRAIVMSPKCRQEGESKSDCVSRKVPEIMDEQDVDNDQAVAIANSMCEDSCGENQ